MGRVLTPDGEFLEAEFESIFGWSGCSCFISPLCGYCTHLGNPLNLECTPEVWMEEWEGFDVMESRAKQVVADVVEHATIRHLKEMKEMYGSK